MFGGLAVQPKARRKRGQVAAEGAPVEAQAAQPAEEPPARTTPFFAKFEIATGQTTPEEAEDEDKRRTRRRLERFYEEYNPSKLTQIDQTLRAYEGREEDMFDALVKKYGPEPRSPEISSKNPPPATKNVPNGTESESGSVAAEFTSEPSAVVPGWVPAPDPDLGSGGWSQSGGNTQGFVFGSDGAGRGFGFTGDSAVQGFGLGSDVSKGFGFAAESSDPPAAGFGFVEHSDSPPQSADPSPCGQMGLPGIEQKSSPSSDDDEPTMNERHQRVLHELRCSCEGANRNFSSLLRSLAEVVSRRSCLVDSYHRVEKEIEECTQREDYARADELNGSLENLGVAIDDQDERERCLVASLPQAESAVRLAAEKLAAAYAEQRKELLETMEDEERKTHRYIVEQSSRLENSREKMKAALDRATRSLHNTEQEVINFEQRQRKIQEKIEEQTSGLRSQREKLAEEKEQLDAEVKELAAKLELKRRQSADKKIQLASIDEKLKIILDEHSGTVKELELQLSAERRKQIDEQRVVDELTAQDHSLLNETRRLDEEKKDMLSQIVSNKEKVERYEAVASAIREEFPAALSTFKEVCVDRVLGLRSNGRSLLAHSPHRVSTSVEMSGGSPLFSSVHRCRAQLAEAKTEVQTAETRIGALELRIQEIHKNIPFLEAAKKAAALAKQFKEAQARTEDIKRHHEERCSCEAQLEQLHRLKEEWSARMTKLERDLEGELRVASQKAREFSSEYFAALMAARERAQHPPSLWTDDDGDDGGNSSDIVEAVLLLIQALQNEHARVVPQAEETAECPQVTGHPENYIMPSLAACASDVPDPLQHADKRTAEELHDELNRLEESQAEAVSEDRFDDADKIQSQIDALNVLLAAQRSK
jgi:hypothetical protein